MNKNTKTGSLVNNERGEFGVKQIAATVAVIVIIGAIVVAVRTTFLETWIGEIWDMFVNAIKKMTT